jgi:uncharacterized protein (TIGR03792 family)
LTPDLPYSLILANLVLFDGFCKGDEMVIEWLKVHVAPELREQYIQKDDQIWTTALSQFPGFLSKEVWISPDNLAEVILVIRWESFEQWQSIPAEALQRVDAQFLEAMGNTSKIVESTRYQVRRFPQP